MVRVRGRPLAVALIGLLLVGIAPAWVQSQPRQAAQADQKKKTQATATKATKRAASKPAEASAPGAQGLPARTSVLPTPRALPPPAAEEPAQPPTTPPDPQQSERVVAPVSYRASTTQLNMVLTAPEQIGQVPGDFFWIRQGLQAARDPVDGALVFLSDEGRTLGRAVLPNSFAIVEIVGEPEQVRLVGEGRQVVLPRGLDPATTTILQDVTIVGSGGTRQSRLVRRGPQQLTLEDSRRTGARSLEVRSLAGGRLAQAYDVSSGRGDDRYVVSEEIIAAKPTLQVRMFVQRFDRGGKLTGVAYVPLDGMDSVPRDFITVTGDGVVRVLVPQTSGVKMRDIAITAPPPQGKRLSDGELKSFGRTLREVPVDCHVMGDTRTPFRRDAPALELRVATPPIKRDTVLQNARAFLTVNWVMQRENFSKPGVDDSCEPRRAKFWARPRRFTEAMIGTTIGPMPYRWGGDDTPATYLVRTEWGALAGDICTCRDVTLNYCLFPESAGTDCSGFVSRAWGIEKRGTAGLLDVADQLDSISELKPGDAFDWPERHIRLFMESPPGAATTFTVLESSTRRECDGVCERTYRPSELNGYKIIRYRGISETGVAANDTSQPGASQPPGPTADSTAPAVAATDTPPKSAGKGNTSRRRQR